MPMVSGLSRRKSSVEDDANGRVNRLTL